MKNLKMIAQYKERVSSFMLLEKTKMCPEPWIVAIGFDEDTETWSGCRRFSTKEKAKEYWEGLTLQVTEELKL